jgi:uncharacterized protein
MRIAVFAKAPVAGRVKTRLAPLLGDEGAATLHKHFVRRALATAVQSRLGRVELWCAPDESHPFFSSVASEYGVRLRTQSGRDLGARMNHAFEMAHAEGEVLLLIGCDCLVLDAATLRDAAAALASYDAVFAPAEDGGYVLAGLSAPGSSVFEGIEWSTPSVMAETRERLAAAGMRWKELATHWDVDRPDDYVRAQAMGLLDPVNA